MIPRHLLDVGPPLTTTGGMSFPQENLLKKQEVTNLFYNSHLPLCADLPSSGGDRDRSIVLLPHLTNYGEPVLHAGELFGMEIRAYVSSDRYGKRSDRVWSYRLNRPKHLSAAERASRLKRGGLDIKLLAERSHVRLDVL